MGSWGGSFLTKGPNPPDKNPTPTPQIAHPLCEGGGEEDAAWRVRSVGFSTADRAFAPAAGALHHLPQHRGRADVTRQPSPNSPSPLPWSRPHHRGSSRAAPREARDRGLRARPYALLRRSLGAASVCSGQQRSHIVPESAAVLLGPTRSAPATHGPTAPWTPAPKRHHELPAAPPVGQQLHGQSAKWVHDRPAASAAAAAAALGRQPWGHARLRDHHCREGLHSRASGLSGSP